MEQTSALVLVGKTRANDVWHRLREDILCGVLAPGEKLRFEHLKTVYGVAFATLREALSRLTDERLVVADAQKGFTVAPISVTELLDITRVRVLVECEALTESIRNGDSEWRADVLRSYHRLDRLTLEGSTNAVAWTEAHGGFHASLVAGCASPLLRDLCHRLFDSALRYRRISMAQRTYGRDKSRQHRELMEAALTGDAEGARRLIHDHVWETTRNVIAIITGASQQPQLSASPPPAATSKATVLAVAAIAKVTANPARAGRLRTKARKIASSTSEG